MPNYDDDWPTKADESLYINPVGQFTALTRMVFEKEFGPNWYDPIQAKQRKKASFSGRSYALETLKGPEDGILHPAFRCEPIEVLNISKNQLTNVDVLSYRRPATALSINQRGEPLFKSLSILNVSKNMLSEVRLDIECLLEVNLSYNDFTELPDFSCVSQLQKLLIGHNRIDSDITQLAKLKKLRVLDLSHNRLSWVPSAYKRQLNAIERNHIAELKFYPNPFADYFKEYQFLTVIALDSLRLMDDWPIDNELRANLNQEAENIKMNGPVDWSIFDAKVEKRKKESQPIKESGSKNLEVGVMPTLSFLLQLLNKSLDRPAEHIQHVYEFSNQVDYVWRARFSDRSKLMKNKEDENSLKSDEEARQINEFVDKMGQMLARYESVRDILIKALSQLMASGIDMLGRRCATLLAEWMDANRFEIQNEIEQISLSLFQDLCIRCVRGMQSFAESPIDCHENTYRKKTGGQSDSLEERKRKEDIGECASVLQSLSAFASSRLHFLPSESPLRSQALKVFLPVICREKKLTMELDKPKNEWGIYPDFDAFPEDQSDCQEVPRTQLDSCKQRCVRHGFSGYVADDLPDDLGSDTVKVYFKKRAPQLLMGARRRSPGRILYVRPFETREATGNPNVQIDMSWHVWANGLIVLVAATDDTLVAARAVKVYGLHKVVVHHASIEVAENGFTESWMVVAKESEISFALLMRLARNLCEAAGQEGVKAVEYFANQEFHKNCWSRLRTRLMKGGFPLPQKDLRDLPSAQTAQIAALVGVVCRMCRGAPAHTKPEITDAVIMDLYTTGEDVYRAIVDIAADSSPDPLLLSSSLEIIWTFLRNDSVRPKILETTMERLHNFHSKVLLPYIQGPQIDGADNRKYQDLWRRCCVKYEAAGVSVERLNQMDPKELRARVPALKNLKHPLMFRVLLGIVRLFELVNDKAPDDSTGMLKTINDQFDELGREELLIGPTSGLVSCPNYDVKIECLRCIRHVVTKNAEQFKLDEMGWLLRYFTSVGIGVGKQELFLFEMLGLVTQLIRNPDNAGKIFRSNFGKAAIREAFNVLNTNSKRELSSNEEEVEHQQLLNSRITEMLLDCSRPISGGLRRYLENMSFVESFTDIICHLDSEFYDQRSSERKLFDIWTGRCIRHVLLPLVTDSKLRPHGASRYRALVRMADVLEGRLTYDADDKFEHAINPDEREWWLPVCDLKKMRLAMDELERSNIKEQQEEFASCFGVTMLFDVVERCLLEEERGTECYKRATALFKDSAAKAEAKMQKWCDQASDSIGWLEDVIGEEADAKKKDIPGTEIKNHNVLDDDAQLLQTCKDRIRIINAFVADEFQCNLMHFDENTRTGSLNKIANCFKEYFKQHETSWDKTKERYPAETDRITKIPNEILYNGKLSKVTDIPHNIEGGVPKIRQEIEPGEEDLRTFEIRARQAHVYLKERLVTPAPRPGTPEDQFKKTQDWARKIDGYANEADRRMNANLVDFLHKHGATVVDPGPKTMESIEDRIRYKYVHDISRIRDAARLTFDFRSLKDLLSCFEEMYSNFKLFRVVRVKNRYSAPTGLGRRWLLVNVEVTRVENHEVNRHICEIRFVVNEHKLELGWKGFLNDLESMLRKDCEVPPRQARPLAKFMAYLVESRTIRHMDVVHLEMHSEEMIEVDTEEVFSVESSKSDFQAFAIERVKGFGSCRIGDVIRLRNIVTEKYVDVSSIGQVHCRYNLVGDGQERSRFKFVLEGPPVVETKSKHKKTPSNKGVTEQELVHGFDQVRLRVCDADEDLYLTAPKAGWRSKERIKVLAKPAESDNQVITIIRKGSLVARIRAAEQHNRATSETEKNMAREQNMKNNLHMSLMATTLPCMDDKRHEGGSFRQEHTTFRAIAHKLAGAPDEGVLTNKLDYTEVTRMPLFLAAAIRCCYALVKVPYTVEIQTYLLQEFWAAGAHGKTGLRRLTELVYAVQTLSTGDRSPYSDSLDLTSAWLPAKFLRLLSTILQSTPCGGPRFAQNTTELKLHAAERRRQEKQNNEYVQNHVRFLDGVKTYMARILAIPLLKRLEGCVHQPLNKHEIMLLREFATCACALVQSFNGNSMRWNIPAEDTRHSALAVTDTQPQYKESHGENDYSQRLLSVERRAEVFSQLVPAPVLRVLVQSMLYAMHKESTAFHRDDGQHNHQNESAKRTVKLLASLVNHSIHAVCACMQNCNSSKRTSCEYDICEAISQAKSQGAQVVPQARVNHFMIERGTERFRPKLLECFQNSPKCRPGENITTIAFAWSTFLPLASGGAAFGASKHSPFLLKRYLVATTSHSKLILAKVKLDGSSLLPSRCIDLTTFDEATIELASVRELEKIRRMIVSPKMPQFIGLFWEQDIAYCETQLEVLIFESSMRRRFFRDTVVTVCRQLSQRTCELSTLDPKGFHQVLVREEFMAALQDNCRDASAHVEPLVSVYFCRPSKDPARVSKAEDATIDINSDGSNLEVLVLARDTMALLKLKGVLGKFSIYYDEKYLAEEPKKEVVEDSDSDEDDIARIRYQSTAIDGGTKIDSVWSDVWELKKLQGIWFMSEKDGAPTVKFSVQKEEAIIHFFSDCDRQRFRQQLFAALAHIDNRDDRGLSGRKKGWVVDSTVKDKLQEVKKEPAKVQKPYLALTRKS